MILLPAGPTSEDTLVVLWRKINQALSQANGGAHAPDRFDAKHDSMRNVLALLLGV